MRISRDPAKNGWNQCEHDYPLLLAARLFEGDAWVDLVDERPLGDEHDARRVASGTGEGRVPVRVFTGHEDGWELVGHVISRDATKGESDVPYREADC